MSLVVKEESCWQSLGIALDRVAGADYAIILLRPPYLYSVRRPHPRGPKKSHILSLFVCHSFVYHYFLIYYFSYCQIFVMIFSYCFVAIIILFVVKEYKAFFSD